MAVHNFPAATKLTVSAPKLLSPVMSLRRTIPAAVQAAAGVPFIDHTEMLPTFAMFDGQVELGSDWVRGDPKVFTPNSLKNDEIGRPLREAMFTNHNADMRIEVDSLSLVGRTAIGRGVAHKITAETPLKLEDRKLKVDLATAPWVLKIGDVMTGPLIINNAGWIGFGSPHGDVGMWAQSGDGTTGAPRWAVQLGGANATFSTFNILRFNDAGTQFSALSIDRTTGGLTVGGHLLPSVTGTINLGSASFRFGTVFTADLSLNNGIGDWTIVEGEDDLFLYNNKRGKVYKFTLTEVDPSTAPPKKV